jgi:hypothetical protein
MVPSVCVVWAGVLAALVGTRSHTTVSSRVCDGAGQGTNRSTAPAPVLHVDIHSGTTLTRTELTSTGWVRYVSSTCMFRSLSYAYAVRVQLYGCTSSPCCMVFLCPLC